LEHTQRNALSRAALSPISDDARHCYAARVFHRRRARSFIVAKRHGVIAVERAAQIAFDAGGLTYRAVKAYLDRSTSWPISLRQIDPLICDLTEYRDLVCRITQGETP